MSCKKDPVPVPQENNQNQNQDTVVPVASALTQKINQFIKDVMSDVYLWNNQLPDIDIKYEMDSKAYFYKLLYVDDKWSYITDDWASFQGSLQGVEKTFGYDLAFGIFSNTGTYFAVVEYVYPDSPAALAGLKRGDIIVSMNGKDITKDNYTDLLYAENVTITMGIYDGQSISKGEDKSLTALVMNLDPVQITKVFEEGGHKIGYLFYAQYITGYNSSLEDAFQYFKDQQITDLVLDLRYNPGGYLSAAQLLCSSVAPLNVVNSNSTLVTLHWNDSYQQYWEQNNVTDQLYVNFTDTAAVKLGLNEIYILTGQGTASASELTITGLKPYMNVITVGDTTYGKYTASISVTPDMIYSNATYYSGFSNWGLQPIVIQYANSEGITDFKNGFAPDFLVDDNLFAGIPLGNIQDPLLKKAIENITGTQIVAMKKAHIEVPDYRIFDQGFSKFDANKRELINDLWNRKLSSNK